MITKSKRAQSNRKASKNTKQNHTIPNQTNLIERGTKTACNRKLNYHDSYTLCKG
jgi:hypothetical protein